MSDGGKVRRLADHNAYHADFASIARSQVVAARQSRNLDHNEFGKVLGRAIGWTPDADLVESWETSSTPPGEVVLAVGALNSETPATTTSSGSQPGDFVSQIVGDQFADVRAIYMSRVEFTAAMPPESLLSGAHDIAVAGLSLNILCQQYTDHRLRELIEGGTTVRALFLAPGGEAIAAREKEEGNHQPGRLSLLTSMNIEVLQQRVAGQLANEDRDRLQIYTYDETIRFNLMIVNDELCIAQPYLPATRGVDSPTIVIERRSATGGMFGLFREMFEHLWKQRQEA